MAKAYEELKFTDDFMFCKVLSTNPDICREMLELILGKKITGIQSPENQKTIEITSDGKGIRLDVYLEDDIGTVYDIEMQTSASTDLPYRSRYYQGMIDLNLISRGADYRELRHSYVIFICLEDLFHADRCIYTFDHTCREDRSIILNDGSIRVFLNASGKTEDNSKELQNLIQYLSVGVIEGQLIEKINQEVVNARNHEEWRIEYMTLLQREREKFNEGKQEGLKEGLKEGLLKGIEEGKLEGLRQGIIQVGRSSGWSDQQIIEKLVELCHLSDDEANQLL